jgi:hypothetical protein
MTVIRFGLENRDVRVENVLAVLDGDKRGRSSWFIDGG